MNTNVVNPKIEKEIILNAKNGLPFLILNTLLVLAAIALFIVGIVFVENTVFVPLGVAFAIVGGLYGFIVGPILYIGLRVIKPNEALVLTLFGKYIGTLKGEGIYHVHPFATAVSPVGDAAAQAAGILLEGTASSASKEQVNRISKTGKKISLKAMTLSNDKQKINDSLGNPIIIGIVVIWKVVDTAKAVFNVDNYPEYLSTQCDSALRNIVRMYPYDINDDESGESEKSLRGSSQEISEKLRAEIQQKADIAGIEIVEARITHLAYAPEIAAAMLQRQQASAIVDARQLIVEGAVGMVELALNRLGEHNVVNLDEERKAAMVSNLMVVLCGNKDAQPIVNSGSLY